MVIEKISRNNYEFDESKPVYAAWDLTGWFVRGKKIVTSVALSNSIIKKEGNYWRVKNLKNRRFTPVQIINPELPEPYIEENIAWARIEHAYPVIWSSLEFVDTSGPCFCLGESCPQMRQ